MWWECKKTYLGNLYFRQFYKPFVFAEDEEENWKKSVEKYFEVSAVVDVGCEESIADVDGLTTIHIDAEHIDSVKKDFLKAAHALILFEPEKFISSVDKIEGKHFVSGKIKYYDYAINPIQMYMFLTRGTEEIQTNKYLSMTYDNRYRHLLCKDVAFENQ